MKKKKVLAEQILTSFRYAFCRNRNNAPFHSSSQTNIKNAFLLRKNEANVSSLELYQDPLILRHTNTEHVLLSLQSYTKQTDPI